MCLRNAELHIIRGLTATQRKEARGCNEKKLSHARQHLTSSSSAAPSEGELCFHFILHNSSFNLFIRRLGACHVSFVYVCQPQRLVRCPIRHAADDCGLVQANYARLLTPMVSQIMNSSSVCRVLSTTNPTTVASSTKPSNGVMSGIKSNGSTK